MRRLVAIVCLLVGVPVAGYVGAAAYENSRHPEVVQVKVVEPYCPSEDSCEIDYRDGRWHITEVTP